MSHYHSHGHGLDSVHVQPTTQPGIPSSQPGSIGVRPDAGSSSPKPPTSSRPIAKCQGGPMAINHSLPTSAAPGARDGPQPGPLHKTPIVVAAGRRCPS